MQFSVSRVQTFIGCAYRYKLQYVDKLVTYPDYTDPANALYLGTALHTGLEKSVEEGIKEYYMSYPVINDLHVNEAIKLEYLIPLAKEIIPDGKSEVKLMSSDFLGFIDLLVDKGNGHFDIWDFKYSNNVDKYMQSFQLDVYRKKFEQLGLGKVDETRFLIIPKTSIRQKKTEDLRQFRARLLDELSRIKPLNILVHERKDKVEEYEYFCEKIKSTEVFEKNPNRLCDWCPFQGFCESGNDFEIDWNKTKFKNLEDYKEKGNEIC